MRRFLIWLACAATAASVAPGAALAGTPGIEVDADVPFSAAELSSAVALRTSQTPPLIRVSPAPEGDAVIVVVGTERRTVALGGLRGTAAARRVAVVSLDLLERQSLPAPAPAAPVAAAEVETPARPSAPSVDLELRAAPPPEAHQPRVVLDLSGLLGVSGRGGAAHASIGLGGPLRGLVSAELEIDDGADHLRVTTVPIGAGAGWRWQGKALAVEAHGRVVVAPQRVAIDDGADRLRHSEVRFGAGALVSAALRLVGPVQASLTGRLGGYLDRQRYLVGGREVFANSRADASISLGVSLVAGGAP